MLYVYIVFVKYIVCLYLYVKTFSRFTTSDNTVSASGMTAFLPTASSYLVMGIVNNTKKISAVVAGEDSQDPIAIVNIIIAYSLVLSKVFRI